MASVLMARTYHLADVCADGQHGCAEAILCQSCADGNRSYADGWRPSAPRVVMGCSGMNGMNIQDQRLWLQW
jgi:hypothetical protein